MSSSAANYWSRWGLRRAPFRAREEAELYHLSPTHEEALARLHFLVENRRRLGLLLGETGSGKSLLLARFARELQSLGIDGLPVEAYGLSGAEFLRLLAVRLTLLFGPNEPPQVLWARIGDRLAERRYQRLSTVLLLDDLDCAAADVLGVVVRLLQLEAAPDSPLIVIAAAETRRAARLGVRLLDLADLRIDIEPWTKDETAAYLEQSLAKAGRHAPLFDDSAVARLHELTRGRPRRIGQIADLALIAAAGQDRNSIDSETIETVYEELTISPS
jgi:type II secretory pathway predicted ATPase ExeA